MGMHLLRFLAAAYLTFNMDFGSVGSALASLPKLPIDRKLRSFVQGKSHRSACHRRPCKLVRPEFSAQLHCLLTERLLLFLCRRWSNQAGGMVRQGCRPRQHLSSSSQVQACVPCLLLLGLSLGQEE